MRPWIKCVERSAPTGSFVRIQAGQARSTSAQKASKKLTGFDTN
jgi:hypothetical protein